MITFSRKPISWKRVMLMLSILILMPLIGFTVFLSTMQARLILPAKVNVVAAPDVALNYQWTSLATPDGNTLEGIIFLPEGQTAKELILVFPGNMHNPIGFAEFMRTAVYPGRTDVAIAAFSYRGYPNGHTKPSTGTPSQTAMFADAELIYDTLTKRFQPQQVKAVGYSIGTAVAAHLATVRQLNAMALVAPIASVRRIAQAKYPWLPIGVLLRHPFATEDIIASIKTPTTLIYSPTDGLVPVDHVTNILHNANPAIPLVSVEDTNHVTLAISPRLPDILRKALESPAQ